MPNVVNYAINYIAFKWKYPCPVSTVTEGNQKDCVPNFKAMQ